MAVDPFAGLWTIGPQETTLFGVKYAGDPPLPVYGPPTPWWILMERTIRHPPPPKMMIVSKRMYDWLIQELEERHK